MAVEGGLRSLPDVNMHTLLHSAMLGGIAEIGDPTFYLIVLLTAWGPFVGLRSMRGATLQRLFCFFGAAGAVALHIVLEMKKLKPKLFDVISGIIAVALMALMGFRALVDFWKCHDEEHSHKSAADVESIDQHERKNSHHSSSSSRTTTSRHTSHSDHKDNKQRNWAPLTFLTTFINIFAMLPNGRWDTLLIKGAEVPSLTFAVGAGLGFGCVVLFGLFLGSVMQAWANEQRMRFMITCTLWVLFLWTCSNVCYNFYDEHWATDWRKSLRI